MVIKYSLVTEKGSMIMEKENKLGFIVDIKATKKEIKKEIEDLFNISVIKVNTIITPHGLKKAIVSIAEEFSAEEVLSGIGAF